MFTTLGPTFFATGEKLIGAFSSRLSGVSWTVTLGGALDVGFEAAMAETPDHQHGMIASIKDQQLFAWRERLAQDLERLKELMKKQTKCAAHGHDCHQGLFSRNLFVGQRIPLAGVAHQNGTIRFGNNPATSALDRNCKAHELDNLYVVDGSFFPSSAAVNPALTIMANALRVGDHLMKRLGVSETANDRNQQRELAVTR